MTDRRTPDSVGVTFRVLRVMAGWSQREYARVLAKTPGRFGSNKLSATQLGKIEKAKTLLYWHHARYANDSGYPAGLIYLVSRLSADLRDSKINDTREVLDGLQQFVSRALKDLDGIAKLSPASKERDIPTFMENYRDNKDEEDDDIANLPEDERTAKIAAKERCAVFARELFKLFPDKTRQLVRDQAKRFPIGEAEA